VQELASKKAGGKKVVIPWYVMTSGPTRGPTEAFFKEHKFFGLEEENVKFFEQGVLPCISNDGRIILDSKSKVFCIRLKYSFSIWAYFALGCCGP
jgi:UDP-N-acetylglucosamine/UDP-N-acetylgalactosamine diphosphorylase